MVKAMPLLSGVYDMRIGMGTEIACACNAMSSILRKSLLNPRQQLDKATGDKSIKIRPNVSYYMRPGLRGVSTVLCSAIPPRLRTNPIQ